MLEGKFGFGRCSGIFSKSRKKTLLLVLLAISLNVFSSAILSHVALVHAQGGFDYTLSNSGGVRLTPGNPGSTTIIATSPSEIASNVTLACDLTNLPIGTTCSFTPASVTPNLRGNTTLLTMTVPPSTKYSAFNVTVTAQAGSPAPIAPTILTLTVAAKVAVNPTATADLSKVKQTSITVGLNITDSPPFGGFIVAIFYNKAVLQLQGLDYSNNPFGSDSYVSNECSDGLDVPGSGNSCSDKSFSGVGIVRLDLTTNTANNIAVNGTLFSVTFKVVDVGFSAIHFVFQDVVTEPDGFQLQTVAYDGYFTNRDCGGGNLCKPPVVSFPPPLRPVVGRPVSLNGTAVSQNRNGVITEYNWTWGSGQELFHYNSPLCGGLKLCTNVTMIFLHISQNIVTLAAQDNYTASAYYTLTLDVGRIWVDLLFDSLAIDHTTGVIPGTTVHIVATALNFGVNPENSTITLSINNQNVAMKSVQNLAADAESSLIYDWNTGGYSPRVYRLVADLAEVRNVATGQILENDTTINSQGRIVDLNNVRVAFVQLIVPLPGSFGLFLGLNLPETLGLGIVLVAVIVFAAGLVKKSRARGPEPL